MLHPNQIGQTVKWISSFQDEEPNQTFTVLQIVPEQNWCLIEANIAEMAIKPTFTANIDELQLVVRTFTKGTFSVDGETYFEGYNEPDQYWNGFDLPYFTKEVMDKIIASDPDTLKWNGDIAEETDFMYPDDPTQTESQIIVVNGEELKVWAMGYFSWAWKILYSVEERIIRRTDAGNQCKE
jgi:hypothetical protein